MADQKLSGLDEVSSLGSNDLVYISDGGSKRITKNNLEGTIKPLEAVLSDDSLQLGGVDADQFVQADGTNNNFISTSAGSADAGKPISLNSQGKVDESMLGVGSGFTYMGSWTPAAGAEYPDSSGVEIGSFWTVDGLSSDYTFTGGDLAGQVATNSDIMVWSESGWVLTESQLDPSAYLPLTGGELSGNLWMRTDSTGKRFIGFLREDGTMRGAIGNDDNTENFEIILADLPGVTRLSNLKLINDGNVRAEYASPADDKDLITKEYGDAHYLGGAGGGDFMSDGSVPMTGWMVFDSEGVDPKANVIQMIRQDGTDKVFMGTQDGLDALSLFVFDDTGVKIGSLIVNDDGNLIAEYADPTADNHLVTKAYGDANYGGGGGAYLPLSGGKMEGNIEMNADTTGKRFIFWSRDDDTFKAAIGCTDTTEEFELALANTAGDTFISNIKMIPDGNVRAEHAAPAHDDDLVTKGYGDTHYLSGTGGGDFYADGHVPMSGGMTFEAGDDNWINFYDTVNSETRAGIDAAASLDSMYIFLHPVTGSGNSGCYLTLDRKGNLSSSTQNPTIDQDFITKGYGDAHYLSGGGGGDFMSDGSVPMTGILQMNSPATGVMFSRILRDDGTLKLAYGSRDTTNQFELLLASSAGDVEVNKLILKENGNIAAPFASPAADEDLVTKAYGDTHYSGGGGGGDFMADGSVPMTGDFQGGGHKLTGIADGVAADDAATMSQLAASGGGDFMANGTIPMTGTMTFDAPSSGVIFTRILRDDGTLKLAYGSRDTANQFELLLANAAGDTEINKLLLKEDGNIEIPFASPSADGDVVTKAYGDANYLGGAGGGDFYADGHVPMTGDMLMDADATGSRAIQIRRDDGTLKCAIGSWNDTEEMELALLNTAGDAGISRLLLRTNGNVAAPAGATPSADTDLVTKAYGDANYLGGDYLPLTGGDLTGKLKIDATGDASASVLSLRSTDEVDSIIEVRSKDNESQVVVRMGSETTNNSDFFIRVLGVGNCFMKLKSTGVIECTTFPDAPYDDVTDDTLITKGYLENAAVPEKVYNMGTDYVISAANGTILLKTLTANTDFSISLSPGESITLHLYGGDLFTASLPPETNWVGERPAVLTEGDVFIIWCTAVDTYFASYSGAIT